MPRIVTEWVVITLLAASGILVMKWAVLSTPLKNVQGLAKTVGSI